MFHRLSRLYLGVVTPDDLLNRLKSLLAKLEYSSNVKRDALDENGLHPTIRLVPKVVRLFAQRKRVTKQQSADLEEADTVRRCLVRLLHTVRASPDPWQKKGVGSWFSKNWRIMINFSL